MTSRLVRLVFLCLMAWPGVCPVMASGHGYLTPIDVRLIREHWGDYFWAASMARVPVALLPAIHYRESELSTGWWSPRRHKVIAIVGGPFGLDKGGEGTPEFAKRIRAYEVKVFKFYGLHGEVPHVSRDFRFAALVAAHELRSKLRHPDCWTDAVWGYNGRSTRTPMKKNPYLFSDPARGVRLILRSPNRAGEMVSRPDTRPGVMVLYKEIRHTFE